MPLYVRDGFEHGTTSLYSVVDGSPSFVASPVRTGDLALELVSTAASEAVRYAIPAGNRQVTTSFYIRYSALPGAATTVFATFVATGNGAIRYNLSAGLFELSIAANTATGGPTIVIDTWYLVDMFCDTSTGTASLSCRVDGGTEFVASGAQAASDITAVRIGQTNANTVESYFDDWGISLTNGDYPIGAHAYEDPTLTPRVGVGRAAGN